MTGRWVLGAATLLAIALTWGASDVAWARDGAQGCTVAELDGLYFLILSGFTMPSGTPEPKAAVEVIRFTGDGTAATPAATRSVNGMIIEEDGTATGTYTVASISSADGACTGKLTITNPPSGPHFDLFFTLKGEFIGMIQTDANNVFQGKAVKISR